MVMQTNLKCDAPPVYDFTMSLDRIDVLVSDREPLPTRVRLFLDDASTRIDEFIERHRDNPAAGFVPSDYQTVYRMIRSLRSSVAGGLLPGNAFCEWGSGMGVIASLASMTGFDAVGIEIDNRLVEEARLLANDHHVQVELVQGSYVPSGHETDDAMEAGHVMTLEDGRAAYDELGLEPDDFDCIFAYPWPGEDDLVASIFDRYAARGAVLMTFHGQDGLMLRRKVK